MAHTRKCVTCGKDYEYCNKCNTVKKEPWKALYCSENCKTIFDACNRFVNCGLSAEDAQDILKDCDLTERKTFKNQIKNNLNDIYATKTTKLAKKKTLKKVVEELPVEPEPIVEIEPVIEEEFEDQIMKEDLLAE